MGNHYDSCREAERDRKPSKTTSEKERTEMMIHALSKGNKTKVTNKKVRITGNCKIMPPEDWQFAFPPGYDKVLENPWKPNKASIETLLNDIVIHRLKVINKKLTKSQNLSEEDETLIITLIGKQWN